MKKKIVSQSIRHVIRFLICVTCQSENRPRSAIIIIISPRVHISSSAGHYTTIDFVLYIRVIIIIIIIFIACTREYLDTTGCVFDIIVKSDFICQCQYTSITLLSNFKTIDLIKISEFLRAYYSSYFKFYILYLIFGFPA